MSDNKKNCYLFVHFKEKSTPDGEQVYFGISRDGYHWEEVYGGKPILWAMHGDFGVRDCAITRYGDNKFVIAATDLSLAYGMRNKYKGSWGEICHHGSENLAFWYSDDLVHWSEQTLIPIGKEKFGCRWAPDITYDRKNDDYVIHFSASEKANNYEMAIFYSRTKDFVNFSEPELLYRYEKGGVIDSAIYEENGVYYLFVKAGDPSRNIMLRSNELLGPYERVYAFDEEISRNQPNLYEAAAVYKLSDGKYALMLDFYGARGKKQGYVPFVSEDISKGVFLRDEENFTFPYRFKHGTVLPITEEEYERIKTFDFDPD